MSKSVAEQFYIRKKRKRFVKKNQNDISNNSKNTNILKTNTNTKYNYYNKINKIKGIQKYNTHINNKLLKKNNNNNLVSTETATVKSKTTTTASCIIKTKSKAFKAVPQALANVVESATERCGEFPDHYRMSSNCMLCLHCNKHRYTQHNCTIRDTNNNSIRNKIINNKNKKYTSKINKNIEMPLSQGFYASKGMLATKRGFKAMKIYGREEALASNGKCRKINNNNNISGCSSSSTTCCNNNNSSCSNSSENQQQNYNQRFGTTMRNLYVNSGMPPNVRRNNNNNNNTDKATATPFISEMASNLQLYYLLGESLARYGKLQEAFDVYALIASEQSDGCVPLDRLNKLASCLISYIRQLTPVPTMMPPTAKTKGALDVDAELKDDIDFVGETLLKSGSGDASNRRLESTLKAKFVKFAKRTSNWNLEPADFGPDLPTNMSNMSGNESLNSMHSPTRELYTVSATHGETTKDCAAVTAAAVSSEADYDPLSCPLCRDILRNPVTTNCGHTYCRQCCEMITSCNICRIKFPKSPNFDADLISTSAATITSTSTARAGAGSPLATRMSPNLYNIHFDSSDYVTQAMFSNNNTNSNNNNNNGGLRTFRNSNSNNNNNNNNNATTVTTTTVASTTATTTTTMASSPDGNANINTYGRNMNSINSGSGSSMKFMPDVLVRRLVEKWWGSDLQANKINETATSYMHLNMLDDALKFCNASLEKSPTNFKSLLLRAEVLRKMNHFQSSLADVENAIKSCNISAKAHYMRALTLSELGRFDEALYDNCLAISLDNASNLSSSEIFQHDLTKLLQKLLTQTPKCKRPYVDTSARAYNILSEQRLRRKQLVHAYNYDDEDDDYVPYGKRFALMTGIENDVVVADDDGLDDNADDVADVLGNFSKAKSYDLRLRQHTSRKYFRRKWLLKETELMPQAQGYEEARCSAIFQSILERTRQEIKKRLKDLSKSNEQKKQLQVPANLIDASDFDCVLCCRTFWKPVVTPCGHTYCLVCLDRCMDYTSLCPLCMSPLVEPNVNTTSTTTSTTTTISTSATNLYAGSMSPVPFMLAKRPVTKFLEAAMKRFIPDSYEKRFRQEIDMEPSVPVFICTTAFPHVPCPLFVYEPRYRLMVRRAVESGEKQFGIVQPHNGKSRYCDVGTILDIRDCVLLGDGCSILSTVGYKRFKILARNEKDGYETAKVEYIYDESIADENVKFVTNMHATVMAKAVDWFESLSTELKQEIFQSFGDMPVLEDNWESVPDGPAWAWWIIALLPLSQQLKVDILATTSLEKRLRAIEKTLDYMSATFRRSQQDCSVVVVQQQQHHHHHLDHHIDHHLHHLPHNHEQQQHHHQQDQEQHQHTECASTCHSDECCLRVTPSLTRSDGAHNNANEHAELLL